MINTAEVKTPQSLVLTVLSDVGSGRAREAVNVFAQAFTFQDRGIGFQCTAKDRLIEFYEKARELYPDSVLAPGTIISSGDDVTLEWTLRCSVSEPFFGGRTRTVPVLIHGASVVRTQDGLVTRWCDYYDGLAARRTALSSFFTEWVEL
jgi:hypothetical protein